MLLISKTLIDHSTDKCMGAIAAHHVRDNAEQDNNGTLKMHTQPVRAVSLDPILPLITYVRICLLQTQLLIIVVVWIVLIRVRLDDVIAVETGVIVATSVVIVRRR